MTRGRRKDLTIPPSRALLQQRDYRARKAQYVSDLEDRVRRTEDENDRLKKEVETLRLRLAAGGTLGPSPEVVAASSELMHQLTTAAASLAKFQQIAFNEQAQAQAHAHAHALAQAQMQTQNLQPAPPSDLELPPIRAPPPPSHDQRTVGGAFPTLPPPPSPPRQTLHPSRHQPQPEFRHHSLSPSAAPREYMRDPGPPPPPLRAPPGPGQGAPPGPASVSASASAGASAGVGASAAAGMRLGANHRPRAYAEYNEVENAWGYFDSRDLADEDDEEDELYEDDHASRRRQEREGGMSAEASSGSSSSYLTHRMSTLRSTSSTPPADDAPMRMQEDIPMRTR